MASRGLYRKPFIVAGCFLGLGIGMMAVGGVLGNSNMDFFAMALFGLLFVITGIVTFAMYGAMDRRWRRLMGGEPLLRYTLDNEKTQKAKEKNVRELRGQNKALLTVMLFFCVLFAVVLPFFVEEKLIMVLICLGLGAFLTLSAWLITAYRVRKLKRGGSEVILSRGGAYLNGEFHSWDMPGTSISSIGYQPPGRGKGALGELRIEYAAEGGPVPQSQTIILLVPAELDARMPEVLRALEGAPDEDEASPKLP